MTNCFIGLGSNQQAPAEQLQRALQAIDALPNTQLLAQSSLYSSTPMGPSDQPRYVNAVAEINTQLPPHDLLKALQNIEQQQGRVRKGERWGPRTLDLDILLIGQQVIDTSDLVVPHYGMRDREFVLYPLFEIAPKWVFADGVSLQSLIQQTPLNGLYKLDLA